MHTRHVRPERQRSSRRTHGSRPRVGPTSFSTSERSDLLAAMIFPSIDDESMLWRSVRASNRRRRNVGSGNAGFGRQDFLNQNQRQLRIFAASAGAFLILADGSNSSSSLARRHCITSESAMACPRARYARRSPPRPRRAPRRRSRSERGQVEAALLRPGRDRDRESRQSTR
jgi:hypothetical protein